MIHNYLWFAPWWASGSRDTAPTVPLVCKMRNFNTKDIGDHEEMSLADDENLTWGWGDSLVGKVPAARAGGPELDSQESLIQPGLVAHACSDSTGVCV